MDDPALSQDQLPQPYRMIWKVIDEYILDPAWLKITQLHPELLQDETGGAFRTPHNQALQNICTPSSVTELVHGSTSVVESEGLLFMSTDDDAFVVVDPVSGKIVQSLVLEEPPPIKSAEELEAEAAAAAAAADPKAKKGKAPVEDAPKPKPQKASSMWIASNSEPVTGERVVIFAVASMVTSPEERDDPNGDPKKKGPPIIVQIPKARILVVQVTLGSKERFNTSLIGLRLVGQTEVPLETASVASLGKIDVSPDGRLLCVSTSLGCSLLRLPAPVETARTAVGHVETVGEALVEVEEVDKDDNTKAGEAPELPLLLLMSTAEFFQGKVLREATLFPLYPRASKLPSSQMKFYDMGITVVFQDAPEWQVLALQGLTADGFPESMSESSPVGNVRANVLLRWRLPAAASAVAFDGDRSTIALGMRDGSLCLWNLTSRGLTSVLGRHEAAVSTLCFSQAAVEKGNRAQHFILSGAVDGSLCLFSVLLPSGSGSGLLTDEVENRANSLAAACVTTLFQTFRLDVNAGVSIVAIRAIGDFSWAAVQCSDGMCAVYDVQSGLLLGRLALYSGMTSRQVAWKPCMFRNTALAVKAADVAPREDDLGYPILEEKGEEGEPPKELADPNAFLRLPPAKRATKYSVSATFNWATTIEANSVATASSLGYHAVYHRNGLPVLAFFKVEDVFLNFYPQLAALLQSKNAYSINASAFFKKLTSVERIDPVAASRRVDSEFDVFGDTRSEAVTAKSGRGTRLNTGATNSRSGDGGTGVSTPGAANSRKGSRNNSLTKKNVDALQDSLGTSVLSVVGDGRIIAVSHERLVEPADAVGKSVQSSSHDRAIRKNRLLNRLGSISNVF